MGKGESRRQKRYQEMLLSVLILLFLICLAAMPVKAAVKLNKTSAVMTVGTKLTLKMKGTKKKVTWKSSNKQVASVSKKGVVKAKKKGSAIITATVNKKKYKCKIQVLNNEFLGYTTHEQAEMTGEGITFFISRMHYEGDNLVCAGFFKNTMQMEVPAGTEYTIFIADGSDRRLAEGVFKTSAIVTAGGYLDATLTFGLAAQPAGRVDLRLVASAGANVDMAITQVTTTETRS